MSLLEQQGKPALKVRRRKNAVRYELSTVTHTEILPISLTKFQITKA